MPTHSTHTPGSVDEALARIDARTQAARDAFERARDFADGLDHVRGRGQRDGVAVVVNHLGVLLEVTYPPALATTIPAQLAAATTAAVRAALADAVSQVGDRARETWGDDPLATQVVAEATARLEAVTR